ncbi:MAG: acyltransferase family protein [Alphaproteobacteria bacterium]
MTSTDAAISPAAGDTAAPSSRRRLHFVQWLRVALIALVVAHHAGQPYGPTGGYWPVADPASSPWLGMFFAFNAAFFMGMFFFVSGYFISGSFDRRGGLAFVKGRLLRLGVPLAFFIIFMFGTMAYFDEARPAGMLNFLGFFVREYVGAQHLAHLWFIVQLLFFSLLYAIWRWLPITGDPRGRRPLPVPGDLSILAFVIALAVVGALVRSAYPQDVWVRIFWIIPAEPAHLPQYFSMFVIGIVAGRQRWLEELPTAVGIRWLFIGIVAFIAARFFPYQLLPAGVTSDSAWGVFEAFVCVGVVLGLGVIFRDWIDKPSRWLDGLDGSVYGVYFIHIFVLVGVQMAILDFALPALVKFGIATVVGLVISFGLVVLIRRIPGVARVI